MSETILISADRDSYKNALPVGIVVKIDGCIVKRVSAFSEQAGWVDQMEGDSGGKVTRLHGVVNVGRITQDQRQFYADAYPDRVEIHGEPVKTYVSIRGDTKTYTGIVVNGSLMGNK